MLAELQRQAKAAECERALQKAREDEKKLDKKQQVCGWGCVLEGVWQAARASTLQCALRQAGAKGCRHAASALCTGGPGRWGTSMGKLGALPI
jgi:hypothetical protein